MSPETPQPTATKFFQQDKSRRKRKHSEIST